MQIFAGVRWSGEGASNESRVVENGDFRFFRSLYRPNVKATFIISCYVAP